MINKFQASRSWLCVSLLWLGLGGCVGIPEGTEPVKDFSLELYLGTWYEIARMDHRFERDLSNVTAEYRLKEDGGVRVLNRGFNTKKDEWKEAEGKAYFVDDSTVGRLKVSFFVYAIEHIEVAYMIAVKRISLLFGLLYGAWLFKETGLLKNLVAGMLMVLGVFLIVM